VGVRSTHPADEGQVRKSQVCSTQLKPTGYFSQGRNQSPDRSRPGSTGSLTLEPDPEHLPPEEWPSSLPMVLRSFLWKGSQCSANTRRCSVNGWLSSLLAMSAGDVAGGYQERKVAVAVGRGSRNPRVWKERRPLHVMACVRPGKGLGLSGCTTCLHRASWSKSFLEAQHGVFLPLKWGGLIHRGSDFSILYPLWPPGSQRTLVNPSRGLRELSSAGCKMTRSGFAVFTARSSCNDCSLSSTEARLQHRTEGVSQSRRRGQGWGSSSDMVELMV
jgi:hypothetical protein